MSPQDDPRAALIRELGVTHCPQCQTPITPATVRVGWEHHPQDYPFGPVTWLVCSRCEHHHRDRGIPPGRVVETEEEAIAILREV
jgi:RNase P subunit RPR2